MDRETYFIQSELLWRGWPRKLIAQHLGEPDCIEHVPGQRYPTLGYMKERVERIEQSDAFRTDQEDIKHRGEAIRAGNATKKAEVLNFAEHAEIRVRKIAETALDRRCRRDPDTGRKRDMPSAQMLALWQINYVRKKLTNEKKLMAHIAHLPGAVKAHWWLRTRILEKIAEVYPSLATWCEKFANERFERVEY